MSLPSQHEYEMREAQEFRRQLRSAQEGSLAERKAAAAEWFDALKRNPDLVAQRIGWLLDGNYGYGSYKAAERTFKAPRMNRVAWFVITIAALEWMTPQSMAVAMWKKLTPEQKARLNAAVERELKSHAEYLKSEGSRDPRRGTRTAKRRSSRTTRARRTLRRR